MYKYFISKLREYIFIFLTATVFLLALFSKSLSEENIFIIDKVKVEGLINLNFSRDKYINKAFSDSFDQLINNISEKRTSLLVEQQSSD